MSAQPPENMAQPETGPQLPQGKIVASAAASRDRSSGPAAEPTKTGQEVTVSPPRIYGTFWLDETEFALEVGAIQEVVNEPEAISAVPLSPAYLLGLFNLRGKIIPVVDLRKLLEFPDLDPTGGQPLERKVAIVEDGDHCVGLLVDHTGEVLNVHDAGRINFRPKQGQIKDVVIEGLINLDGGARIVQVLDPFEILNLKKVPRGEPADPDLKPEDTTSRGSRTNYISFQFGHTVCAIDLRNVEEVMDAPEITDSGLVHGCFIGITTLRGKVVPVADFRNFMGDGARLKSSRELPPKRKMLVIDTNGGPVGLLVYSVDSIISSFKDEVLRFTKLALPRAEVVSGCLIGKKNEVIMILDHDALRRDPELAETAQRCQEVHPPEKSARLVDRETVTSARLVFIIFNFGRPFALDTTQVSEVINVPDTLLNPPYAIDIIEGVMNIRGELITLIDPRKVYRMKAADQKGTKVVIFNHEDRKYGLLVDSVDEIVMTTQNKVDEPHDV